MEAVTAKEDKLPVVVVMAETPADVAALANQGTGQAETKEVPEITKEEIISGVSMTASVPVSLQLSSTTTTKAAAVARLHAMAAAEMTGLPCVQQSQS